MDAAAGGAAALSVELAELSLDTVKDGLPNREQLILASQKMVAFRNLRNEIQAAIGHVSPRAAQALARLQSTYVKTHATASVGLTSMVAQVKNLVRMVVITARRDGRVTAKLERAFTKFCEQTQTPYLEAMQGFISSATDDLMEVARELAGRGGAAHLEDLLAQKARHEAELGRINNELTKALLFIITDVLPALCLVCRYLSYTAPHDPLQADPEYIARCAEVPNHKRRAFCGMMAQLDDGIHNVTQVLKQQGLYDDTVIVFTSDNGGNAIVAGANYPFRGMKSTAWEGGGRVPGFIKAPARFSFPAKDFSGLVHVADWMPTLLGLAGLPGPSKTDGYDLSDAFRSPSASESPRTTAVIQHDVFLNSSSYRSGCYKLVLGCPGGNVRYREPDYLLLRTVDEGRWYLPYLLYVVEKIFDVIELTTPAPIDQFFKYTTIINLARLSDWIEGTSFNHIINPLQPPLSVWHANLTEYPLVMDTTLENGPRSMLFDLCKDPSESHDLSRSDEGQGIAKRLFAEFQEELQGAPLQWAGDTVVKGSLPDRAKAAPFLDEHVGMHDLEHVVETRLFAVLEKAFEALGRLSVGVAATVLILLFVFVCGIPRRGKKEAGSAQASSRKPKSKKL